MAMYIHGNPKTKKLLKQWVAEGRKVTYYQEGPWGGNEPKDGTITIEGPHYPQPHTWYATATVKDGYIVSVK